MKYIWKHARNKEGDLYYYINISESIVIHVWREKRTWNWIIAGYPSPNSPATIFQHGITRTLKETEKQIESLLPPDPEQMVWMNL